MTAGCGDKAMPTTKFSVPNWAQALIARGAGLDPDNLAVRHEDDRNIAYLQYMPRKDILVCKVDGTVIIS